MGFTELINAQYELASHIRRALSNYKKSKNKVTKTYVESRLQLLEEDFKTFKAGHLDILKFNESQDSDYFKEELYYSCEDEYLELKSLIIEQLDEWASMSSTVNQNNHTSGVGPAKYSVKTKLPTIEIPPFTGNYSDWTSFYDLFKSLIHNNSDLSTIQKYHYLKSNLKGDAELLLRQFPLTVANYERALEVLEARYDNKRLIVRSHIARLINQKKLTSESAKGMRSLLDTTNEILSSLNNIGVSTITWDPIITYIIVAKFDMESHRLWEQKLGGTRDVSTTNQLLDFMDMRFRTLEAINLSNDKDTLIHRTSNLKSFTTNYEPVCVLCSQDHHIYNCKEFGSLSPEKRKEIVTEKKLCFNCLIPRHGVRFCRQTTSCKLCGGRHHTLLHVNPTNSSQIHNITQVEDDETKSEIEIPEETTQLASFKADITETQVLLATAMVRVRGKDGNKHMLRALIDQGSQASFITTSAAQRLGLDREKMFSKITGIDAKLSTVSKEVVSFNIYSLHNDAPVLDVKAHVLTTLASILPRKDVSIHCASEINKLLLADPTFHQASGVDLLLGAEVYALILRNGIKRYGSLIAQESLLGWLISGKVDREQTEMKEVFMMHSQLQTENILQRFSESEGLYEMNNIQTASKQKCDNTSNDTRYCTDSECYTVALSSSLEDVTPLRQSTKPIIKCSIHKERRLQSDNKVFQEYYRGFKVQEYEEINYRQTLPKTNSINKTVPLPHGIRRERSSTALQTEHEQKNRSAKTRSEFPVIRKEAQPRRAQNGLQNICRYVT